MVEGGPERGRPRWSFTWLLRIQRIGRDRAERESDDSSQQHHALWRIATAVVLGIILIIEVAVGYWIGFLPLR